MRVLLLAAALLGACGGGDAPQVAPAPVPVRVEVATPAPFTRVEAATGVIVTPDSVEVRAETAGLVRSVHFTDGQPVKAGDVLVRLQDAAAQADLRQARAQANLAELALQRARGLMDRGNLAAAELDAAVAEAELAGAAVQKARDAVRRTTIVAPFDGVLGRRDVSVGQTVDASRVLTRVEALDRLAVDVALPETALVRVAPGQPAEVDVPGIGATALQGTVGYVSPRVAEGTRTVDVRVPITAPDPRLRPGMTATVRVVVGEAATALTVPAQALVQAGEAASVWVVADGKAESRPIVLGRRTRERVEVASGIAAGDAVVVEGLARLRPGAAVEVLQPEAGP